MLCRRAFLARILASTAFTWVGVAAAQGFKIYIDPKTGVLTDQPIGEPTVMTLDHLRAVALNQSAEGLEIIRMPDGSEMMNLEGRFQHSLEVHVADGGALVVRCSVHGEHLISAGLFKQLR